MRNLYPDKHCLRVLTVTQPPVARMSTSHQYTDLDKPPVARILTNHR
jgi:hypothetical protein